MKKKEMDNKEKKKISVLDSFRIVWYRSSLLLEGY